MIKTCPARPAVGTTLALAALLVLAAPNLAAAQTPIQTIFQEQADALRDELHCTPPLEWPDLPRRPSEVPIEAAVDSTGVVSYLVSGVVTSTTVRLPQFAFLYDPTTEACVPAIVLEYDEARSFIYSRPFARTAGAAPVVFFNLLGEDPPTTPAPDAAPDPGPDPDSGSDPDAESG